MTWALVLAPASNAVVERLEISSSDQFAPMRIPVSAGEKLYLAFSAIKGTAYLWLDDDIKNG